MRNFTATINAIPRNHIIVIWACGVLDATAVFLALKVFGVF